MTRVWCAGDRGVIEPLHFALAFATDIRSRHLPEPMHTVSTITPDVAECIAESWRSIADSADAAAQLFFDRVEELDPEMPVARASDEARYRAVRLFGSVVTALDDRERTVALLGALQRAATAAGFAAHHATLVTVALLWTLEQTTDEPLRPETRRAWAAFCSAFMHDLTPLPSGDGSSPCETNLSEDHNQ